VKNVLMLPPFYYKPVSDAALYRYYADVIDKVGDPALRIYLYHIPPNSGVPVTGELITRLLDSYPKVIAGIKDSGGDWNHILSLIKNFSSLRVYSGSEEYLLGTLQEGGVGCISATANITIAFVAEVLSTFRSGADAREQQRLALSLRKVFSGYPFVSALKGFLALEHEDLMWNNMRPPNMPLEQEVMLRIKKSFEETLTLTIH
jgi:4-hydroxy-tetrahydrodipicolinate synthase